MQRVLILACMTLGVPFALLYRLLQRLTGR
jgi:hypothetical protein